MTTEPVPSERDLSRWQVANHIFGGIDRIHAPEGEALVTVETEGAPLDALVDFAGFDTTLVSFHAAVAEPVFTLPYFTGWSLAAGRVNRIALSDPGITSGLPLAWFAGTSSNPASMIAEFIARLTDLSGASNLVFFGASGGGFAALHYARLFPGAVAVPVNPQTNILKYHAAAWTSYARHAWHANDEQDAEIAIRRNVTYDLPSVYATERPEVRVIYLQNNGDGHHVRHHLKPFIAANPDAHILHVAGEWGDGHKPPPAAVLRDTLDEAFETARHRPLL